MASTIILCLLSTIIQLPILICLIFLFFICNYHYSEKVLIIEGKEYIFLEGESSRKTVIQWGDSGSVIESPTFKMFADNFVASKIGFKVIIYSTN